MRKLVSRIVSPFIVGGLGWLAARVGVPMPPEAAELLADGVAVVVVATGVAASGALHKVIDRRIHPTDDAV